MEGELIIVSIISSIFGLCGLMILDRNWFRRENFKIQKANIQAQNKIQIERMRKELGLHKQPSQPTQELGGVGNLLDLAKGLGKDQIIDLVEKFLPDNERDEEGEEGELQKILKYVPPEVIQNALKGVLGSKEGGNQEVLYNE